MFELFIAVFYSQPEFLSIRGEQQRKGIGCGKEKLRHPCSPKGGDPGRAEDGGACRKIKAGPKGPGQRMGGSGSPADGDGVPTFLEVVRVHLHPMPKGVYRFVSQAAPLPRFLKSLWRGVCRQFQPGHGSGFMLLQIVGRRRFSLSASLEGRVFGETSPSIVFDNCRKSRSRFWVPGCPLYASGRKKAPGPFGPGVFFVAAAPDQ